MNNFYIWIESLIIISLSASMLYIFLCAISFCLKNYIKTFIYILLKILILFFLFPVFIYVLFLLYSISEYTQIKIVSDDFSYFAESGNLKSILLIENNNIRHLLIIITTVWFWGFLVLFVFRMVYDKFIMHRVFRFSILYDNKKVITICEELKKELKLCKKIKIYQTDVITSPISVDIFHPKILIPNNKMSLYEMRFILKHELVHIKNHDILFQLLMKIIQNLHWFNPFIYLISRRFSNYSEMICDDTVLEKCTNKEKRDYAKLIIDMTDQRKNSTNTVKFSFHNRQIIEWRIKNIMKGKKKINKTLSTLGIIIFIVTAIVFTNIASEGVVYAQSYWVNDYSDGHSTQEFEDLEYIEEIIEYNNEDPALSSNSPETFSIARGTTNVDITLSGNGEAQFHEVELNKGASIRIVVSSDNEKDSFKAGIINKDNGQRRYVVSVNGAVSHTFEINSSSTYAVYISGNNGSSGKNINIYGRIYVNY